MFYLRKPSGVWGQVNEQCAEWFLLTMAANPNEVEGWIVAYIISK